ncbi:hypothetical protein JI666_09545 [Bacillus sp. NTK071]|nr:hypothetical protein [Bacillus sp. NTK071]MBN8208987.1 hypothetical protein [Bacillus sp. NTK071]
MNDQGERTPIKQKCIHPERTGNFTNENGQEVSYEMIQITADDCGDEFFLNGKERFDIPGREVMNYWMNLL